MIWTILINLPTAIVAMKYASEYMTSKSLQNKINKAHQIPLTRENLKKCAGKVVIVTGLVKGVGNKIQTYNNNVEAVVRSHAVIHRYLVRCGLLFYRTSDEIQLLEQTRISMALINDPNTAEVLIADPLRALDLSNTLNMYAIDNGNTWIAQNSYHNEFVPDSKSKPMSNFKKYIDTVRNKEHLLGIQYTESLIVDRSTLTAIGTLNQNGETFFFCDDCMITTCTKEMLLHKAEVKSEEARIKLWVSLAAIAAVNLMAKFGRDKSKL